MQIPDGSAGWRGYNYGIDEGYFSGLRRVRGYRQQGAE